MPYGGLQVAVRESVPIILYTMVARPADGKRILTIHKCFEGIDASDLVAQLGGVLELQLIEEPAAWHLWPWIDAFYLAGDNRQKASL